MCRAEGVRDGKLLNENGGKCSNFSLNLCAVHPGLYARVSAVELTVKLLMSSRLGVKYGASAQRDYPVFLAVFVGAPGLQPVVQSTTTLCMTRRDMATALDLSKLRMCFAAI